MSYLHAVLAAHPQLLASSPKELYLFEGDTDAARRRLLDAFPGVAPDDARLRFSSPAGQLRTLSHLGCARATMPADVKLLVLFRSPLDRARSYIEMRMRERLLPRDEPRSATSTAPAALGARPETRLERLLRLELHVLRELLRTELGAWYPAFMRDGDVAGLRRCLAARAGPGRHPGRARRCHVLRDGPTLRLLYEHAGTSAVLDSLYSEQLIQWIDIAPPHRWLFVHSEFMWSRPRCALARVEAFLGVRGHPFSDDLLATPVHVWGPRGNDTEPLAVELVAELAAFFHPFNERLRVITGVALEPGSARGGPVYSCNHTQPSALDGDG